MIGRLESKNNKIARVVLPRMQLNNILLRGGFSDIISILFFWKSDKLIDCDEGRLTRERLLVGAVTESVFVINIAQGINLDEVISNFKSRGQL